MRILLLALSVAIGADTYAAPDFVKTYGGPDFDRGVQVVPTEDNGYIAVGVTKSFGEGGEDVYLLRTNAKGELLWSRAYGGADDDCGWSVLETPDGFVFAGFTRSFGQGNNDFYLVGTNRDGERKWSKTYGGEGSDRCWSLIRTNDGGFALAGETASFGEGERDCYLVKTDSLGTEQWSRTYGGEKDDRCFSIVQADDGGFVLAGQTFSEGAGDRDLYIIKTSADGALEWSRTFGGEASDVGHSVTRTAGGEFVVTGYTTSFATAGDDPYLVKVDAQGETLWTRVNPLDGINHTLTGDQAADGGFYHVGFTEYRDRGVTAALLVRTDSEGRLVWHRDFLHESYGEMFGYTVCATEDGGCVFAGHKTSNIGDNLDLLLIRVAGEDR